MRIIFSFSFFERIRFNQYQSTKQMTGFAGVVLSFSCCYSSFESEVIGLIHSPLTRHSLLLETSPLPSENLDSILILLSQSREMLEASLEALQRF